MHLEFEISIALPVPTLRSLHLLTLHLLVTVRYLTLDMPQKEIIPFPSICSFHLLLIPIMAPRYQVRNGHRLWLSLPSSHTSDPFITKSNPSCLEMPLRPFVFSPPYHRPASASLPFLHLPSACSWRDLSESQTPSEEFASQLGKAHRPQRSTATPAPLPLPPTSHSVKLSHSQFPEYTYSLSPSDLSLLLLPLSQMFLQSRALPGQFPQTPENQPCPKYS